MWVTARAVKAGIFCLFTPSLSSPHHGEARATKKRTENTRVRNSEESNHTPIPPTASLLPDRGPHCGGGEALNWMKDCSLLFNGTGLN